MVRAQTRIIQYLLDRGLKHMDLRIGNECTEALQRFFRTDIVDFQLCPPNDHCTNQAKKAIDTWKCHFLSGISGIEPSFPMHIWFRLLPQDTQNLNLLRQSQINPILSVEAQINEMFDYNRTPISPPGTKVLIYETPQKSQTWYFHDKEGWYINMAPLHYQYYWIYVP